MARGSRGGGKSKRSRGAKPDSPKARLRNCRRCHRAVEHRELGFCGDCFPLLLSRWSEHVSSPTSELTIAKYGMTVEEHAALFFDQKGVCAICRDPERSRRRGPGTGLVVDHHHGTGRVRALLCGQCNSAIGLLAENEEWSRRAAQYIRRGTCDITGMERSAARLERRIKTIEEKYEEPEDAERLRGYLQEVNRRIERIESLPVARGHK